VIITLGICTSPQHAQYYCDIRNGFSDVLTGNIFLCQCLLRTVDFHLWILCWSTLRVLCSETIPRLILSCGGQMNVAISLVLETSCDVFYFQPESGEFNLIKLVDIETE
jgi:hypothetical protein